MIYNENGMILNEYHILKEYFNNSLIDDIINESFSIGKTIKAAIDWLVSKVKGFIQWLTSIPNRTTIKKNKDKIKNILSSIRHNEDNKIVNVKLKGDIAKYIDSNGYNNGKWIKTFTKACNMLQSNTNITKETIVCVLYDYDGEDAWFVNDKIKSKQTFNTDEIVDFAIDVSELSKPLKQAYNELIKFNKKLEKDNRINIEVLNSINHYFKQSMVSIKNLSYACITVCMNAYKGKVEDSAEKGKIFNVKLYADNKYEPNINELSYSELKYFLSGNPSEEFQLEAIKLDPYSFTYIKNPTEKVQLSLIERNMHYMEYIKNPSEKVQLAVVEMNPLNIVYIKNPTENVQIAVVKARPMTIKTFKNPSEKVQLAAVEQNPKYINYIKNPTKKVLDYAKSQGVDYEYDGD